MTPNFCVNGALVNEHIISPFPNLHVSQLGGQLFVLGGQHFDLLLQLRVLLRTILHPLLQRFNVVLGRAKIIIKMCFVFPSSKNLLSASAGLRRLFIPNFSPNSLQLALLRLGERVEVGQVDSLLWRIRKS